MEEQYFQIPYGTMYLKVVAGTIYSVSQELRKTGLGPDDWEVITTEKPLQPFTKNE